MSGEGFGRRQTPPVSKAFEPKEVKPHAVGNGTQELYEFPNGYGASVVQFMIGSIGGSYGAESGLWELAVLKDGRLCYDTPVTSDVLGYLTRDDVNRHLAEIDALPSTDIPAALPPPNSDLDGDAA